MLIIEENQKEASEENFSSLLYWKIKRASVFNIFSRHFLSSCGTGGALIWVAYQGKHVMDTAGAVAFHMWTLAEQNLLFSHLQQDLECKQAPSANGDWSAETVV